ncbi:MAG TPA: cytochrome c-type protein NapC [Gammaproteobacteria bacterium]|nr:cytochrome c-type protein NapC [Gammaproteobacteria bacterium]
MTHNNPSQCNGVLCRMWQAFRRPSVKYSVGALLFIGFVAGIVFWGGFNTAMEMTNNEQFCISCHEMKDNVYQEYKNTIHYSNRTGVRATCPDCHVPKEWVHKVIRKIQATNELYHKVMGTIDTREKFLAHRLELAKHVWSVMKKTDSRECRNCHNFEYMDFAEQGRRAVAQHSKGLEEGKTCIDCHKGIAHHLPDMSEVDPTEVVGSH